MRSTMRMTIKTMTRYVGKNLEQKVNGLQTRFLSPSRFNFLLLFLVLLWVNFWDFRADETFNGTLLRTPWGTSRLRSTSLRTRPPPPHQAHPPHPRQQPRRQPRQQQQQPPHQQQDRPLTPTSPTTTRGTSTQRSCRLNIALVLFNNEKNDDKDWDENEW